MAYDGQRMSAEALIAQYQQSGDLALREQLVAKHLYIAEIIARRFSGRGVDPDDLYQVASLALLKAIERFDASKGVRFVSYATPTMVGEVKNYFRDKSRLISLPRRGAQMNRQIREACATLEQELMRAPTALELADALGVPLDMALEALEMQGAMSPLSLDAVIVEEGGMTMGLMLPSAEEGYDAFDRRDLIERVLKQLDDEERRVIKLRFFENESQRSVGELIGVSQMTVSRIERRALTKIREMLDA